MIDFPLGPGRNIINFLTFLNINCDIKYKYVARVITNHTVDKIWGKSLKNVLMSD